MTQLFLCKTKNHKYICIHIILPQKCSFHGVFSHTIFPFTQSCCTNNILVFLDPNKISIEKEAAQSKDRTKVIFVCCVLKQFIRELETPLIPKSVIEAYKPGTIRMAKNNFINYFVT